MNTPSRRSSKVAKLLQQELTQLIQLNLHDERLKCATITEVEVSPNLARANIYVSTAHHEEAPNLQVVSALNRAAGFLEKSLFPILKMRHIPSIKFFYDDSIHRGLRITKLLDNLE